VGACMGMKCKWMCGHVQVDVWARASRCVGACMGMKCK